MECNPGTVKEEKLRLMKAAGVNRISFGIQSSNNRELQLLGRIHTYEDALDSYHLARKFGFDNINIDLMSAIPEQTPESYRETLCRILALNPEHISSYSLIVEEGTPFYERYRDNPPADEETDRRMYELTGELLSSAGYERYEISNYAKPGRACHHNIKYWRREPYIGAGLGAASFLEHKRLCNEKSMADYAEKVKGNQLPVCETEELTKEEEMAEFMYLGLRCMKGISVREFEQVFGRAFAPVYGKTAEKFVDAGLLEWSNDRIRLTPRGIDVSNRIFAEFI
jgi:oxygen-independent coproporphyrinogen-3 oxidase